MRSEPNLPVSRLINASAAHGQPVLRLKPLAHAIALLMLAGTAQAAQPQVFSSGWFGAMGANQGAGAARPSVAQPAGTPPPLAQQQRVNSQLQRSMSNLNNTVAAIAAQQAAQAAGRAAALTAAQTLHNGLGGNGLNVLVGADGKPLFVNAEGPVQTDTNGKALVSIKQTADKAILNWETFNIGRDTTVEFQQNAEWAALNRVNNSTSPSQIQGALKADGTVMILNRNGVVFSGSSQINVRNLVAAATTISDEQFNNRGLFSASDSAPTFSDAAGKVLVEQGAQLQTHVPGSSTSSGGYVLLLGKEVDNAGSINTPRGQTALVAGDSFVIKKGYSTDGNPTSTTRGNEVVASGGGKVSNHGSIQAATGDITLSAQEVLQKGLALSSTSVDARGTLHLNARGSDAKVTLGEGSTSAILIDSSMALDSQREGLLTPALNQAGNSTPADTYRRDQSLVEIVSGGTVDFQSGSITLATGGQVAVNAGQRSLVRDGAVIDVSGAVGVKVAMESNSVKVNIQGNEQRDASVNRDSKNLNNNDVWVDARELVLVPAGTNGYATDRWYTAGGLLEVGGYLGTQPHNVGEWMAQGGSVRLSGNEVVTQQGSQINLSGGTLDVQDGMIQQTWLRAADGRLIELSRAPGDILYSGLYKGFEEHSVRWGQTEYHYNSLIAPRERLEQGYSVGRDAGRLEVSTRNAVLEGQIVGDTFQGDRQTQAPRPGLDGYQQGQNAVARGGQLVVGAYVPYYVKDSASLQYALGADANTVKQVVLGQAATIANGLDLDTVLPDERKGTLWLDTEQLNGFKLSSVKVAATGSILVEGALEVSPGGDITLYGPQVQVDAGLTAHGGNLALGNVLQQITSNGKLDTTLAATEGKRATLTVGSGVRLDTSGLWSNLLLDPADGSRLPYLNGGSVSLRSSADVALESGSLIDVSSGATLMSDGKTRAGKGGNLTLAANANSAAAIGTLTLDGELRGHGVNGGGTLSLQSGKVLIGERAADTAADTLVLAPQFFDKGFAAYDITGNQGLRVADGAQVEVTQPVYLLGDQARSTATGADPTSALEHRLPGLYQEDPIKAVLSQRQGASISLRAGTARSSAADMASTQLVVGKGAAISVDPGQSIALGSIGQLTLDGALNAWGGAITLSGISVAPDVAEAVESAGHGRSIWVGEQAVLDVAARAVTATDALRRRYGKVDAGGTIVIGGQIDPQTGIASAANQFVVVREGARLEASGAQAMVDVAGQGAVAIASSGGSISLASNNGLYLDGSFNARAGGSGAAGGSLDVALEVPLYRTSASQRVRQAREMVVGQVSADSLLPSGAGPETVQDTLAYGHARLGLDKVQAGGFDNLSLLSNGLISFDGALSLSLGQSLQLYAGALALSDSAAAGSRVQLAAPYIRLAGVGAVDAPDRSIRPTVQGGVSTQASTGSLLVTAGNVLDIRDGVSIGAHGTTASGLSQAIDRRAFDDTQLISQGDMRFLASTIDLRNTNLSTQADLRLAAAQIYPATGAVAQVLAGYRGNGLDYDPDRTLSIGRTGSVDPAQPYSVFGKLTLGAAVIEQGGVLRAPLGNISLGTQEGILRYTKQLNLLPGSLTSVSAAGLTLPYGGTVDGVTWRFDGKQVDLLGVGGTSSNANLVVGAQLLGQSIEVQQGAVLDLSGGGQLLGAAFVSGRGGSTDARYNPLVQFGANGRFTLPGLDTNPVYAIVPGVQANVAPSGGEAGATTPLVGQQISIDAGVPGLPAGTYTLLPSTYALLPGAFRVEINGLAAPFGATALTRGTVMSNGSWSSAGRLSIAQTGIQDALSRQVILTPAVVLRSYSQYNETPYADFVRSDAARQGVPRAALEADGKTLRVSLVAGQGNASNGFEFAGVARSASAEGGFGASLEVMSGSSGSGSAIEILPAGATANGNGVSFHADDLNAIGTARMSIGGAPNVVYGQGGNFVQFDANSAAESVTLRQGATLSAPEVFLVSGRSNGAIQVEQGASINTLGRGDVAYDSTDGFIYQPGLRSVLAVSNGVLQMLAPTKDDAGRGPGSILIGDCVQATCQGETTLYSQGTIAFATTNTFRLGDAVRYGTRHLALAVGGVNVGSPEALAAAQARNALPSGLTLNQDVMNRLLRGDIASGAPALETLSLTAGQSLNFYGSTTLSTLDSNGQSMLDNLMLSTPAIYGDGAAGDVALIQTGNLIWNGAAGTPAAVIANGAGTGSGTLEIQARRIEFGYGPNTQPDPLADYARLALGFANVNLSASERLTANHKGSLAVYQSQGAYEAGKGFVYSGGNLNISTPLLTGEAGSVNRITAGGDLRLSRAPGQQAALPAIDSLGAEVLLAGNNVELDSAVVLPSGKLTVNAEHGLNLTDRAHLDLAGRQVMFNEVSQYSWGGDVILQSREGDIRQAAGSLIDLSAQNNHGGSLKVVAVDEGGGQVDLQGQLLGASSGHYDAGGTLVPYKAGSVDIRAQTLGDFAALNQRLNQGQVFGARSFQIKRGDLTIGSELKAGEVNVSVDNGQLTVLGSIDASGERVGSIRLAASQGLTLAGSALLDTHGTALRVDSYGKIIDSPNRAMVELNSGLGQLTLADGARIDLRHGTSVAAGTAPGQYDGQARGTLELNAPRLDASDPTLGDIAIDASGRLNILGARSIAVNGTARYTDAPERTAPAASGRPYQVIDQAYLDAKHQDSQRFIDNALSNASLMNGKLAGLNNATYADAFHLRPGLEIVTQGDLVISGDLDLSGYRYTSVNPHAQKTSVYGSGEPGNLVIRAGGNLDLYGSINDGFAPPPPTPDDAGWVLTPGRQAFGGDVVVPGPGVTLADGSLFPAGKTLNYALPIKPVRLAQGTLLPVEATLQAPLELPAGTVLQAAVRDSAGNQVYAAGTLIREAVTLASGMTLDAGTRLPAAASLGAMIWPAGVPLPSRDSFDSNNPDGVQLAGSLALKVGALIPSETDIKLPSGVISVPLRTVTGGRQGSNWAVASLLPEGSLSWSMRLVSGADTQAADTRAIKPVMAGDLTLADTHYAVFEGHETIIIPGTPERPGGAWFWSDLGVLIDPSFVEGTRVSPADEGWCVDGLCNRFNYVWSDLGVLIDPSFIEGTPVTAEYESWCSDGLCVSLGEAIPGTPEQVIVGPVNKVVPVTQNFSVLRTGTGDLDLLAAGNVAMQSSYGLYTAGASSASRAGDAAQGFDQPRSRTANGSVLGSGAAAYEGLVSEASGSPYAAWYPDQGGNLLLRTGGTLTGDILSNYSLPRNENARAQLPSANLADWLWRQGSGDSQGVTPIPTSWWINYGTYVPAKGAVNSINPENELIGQMPILLGFTGIGTLGGGNLIVDVGSDAGMLARRGSADGQSSPRSQGLVLAVGSTGRVGADGRLILAGGGDLDLRVGGDLNPGLTARASIRSNSDSLESFDYTQQNLNLNGVLSNLRGALNVETGRLGGIALKYGSLPIDNDSSEARAYDPFQASLGAASGGVTLMLGDAAANLTTRGDLVLAGTGDPGRVASENSSAFTYQGTTYGSGGYGWFSLWTDNTAINLFSAGGNLTPSVQTGALRPNSTIPVPASEQNYSTTDGRFIFPSQLTTVAASGSIFLGSSALGASTPSAPNYSLLLAPSHNGRLDLLAGDSIYAGGYSVNRSGADLDTLPTPFRPAFAGWDAARNLIVSNLSSDAIAPTISELSLFAFGANTASANSAIQSSRLYAAQGDIVGFRGGEILSFTSGSRLGQTWYEAAGPVWMKAGRDIVNSGTALGRPSTIPVVIGNTLADKTGAGTSIGNLFVQNAGTDISVVSAGRDLLYSSFNVAGPGTLEISAGRNILMQDKASVNSLGPVVAGDSRPGASIVMQAGVGAAGLDYLKFVAPYLDPINQAQAGVPLAEQRGRVAKTYEAELLKWLKERFAFEGSSDEARGYFASLPAEQQRVFARRVYFEELREGGREYNDANGPRFGSFLRSRNAIASLLPAADVAGNPIVYDGDITLYGGAGVHTLFGGDIQMLTPGGQQVFGIEGEAPPASAGIITQGAGDIQLYSQGSILLGQSRVMTTFGGSILGWSNAGDINAGRGSKTTVIYTPPKRVYDNWGNVTLSSNVPSSGAGIATLAPIAEVPAGDIDLLAPLGTIDAGEAGIRVSGNVNIFALQVVNAANIQTQGESSGIPVVASVNTGALTSASSAASSASQAAEDVARQQQAASRQNMPSVFSVQVLSFGQERLAPTQDGASRANPGYNPNSPVQVLGAGPLSDQARQQLTEEERRQLTL
ncbi:filamentous hemagglutinin family protein [Pseudomonas chlororaphis]|uniref:filamentous haemagglutinin family protein n=1 Tax=Pseudomonas chlororaphis TaxID=587753 RepID=UPI001B3150DF|nr:filamentous haemagglutinin family protein [Pseudomonas chlororaphis]MBP5064868.1 filamentous hemagglutinin family protein [Pseudomonas chlororaphis]QTT94472.1 filamentous hemagglutinin family protein [Pseudomonas chlororaphis]